MEAAGRGIAAAMHDSLRKLFGSTLEVLRKVKIETRSGRFEEKLLVLTPWRLCLLNLKTPAKIESTFNFLEIRNLTPVHPDQVVMETDKSIYAVNFLSLDDLDRVMSHINFALSKIFPTSGPSLSERSSPQSPNCLKNSPSPESSGAQKQASCGGFSETYAALCDYNGIACREEVQWDVDTIYHSQDTRHFNILDFSHLGSRDLALIVAALAYNQWFTKLYTRDLKLGSEVIEQVLHTVSRSRTIEELEMENTGLKMDFALKLAAALAENPFPALIALNLASNQIEDKGVYALSQFLASHQIGLRRLNLSRISLSAKGLTPLAQTLHCNPVLANTLTHLDLSKNPGMLAGEEATNLYNFLSGQNVLVDLNLAGTDCAVDVLFDALPQGCCSQLNRLNLSNNNFTHKKAKETLTSFKTFFSCALSLDHVNFSGIKFPSDALSALFQGLSSNTHVTDLQLNLSGCELRANGAAVIRENIAGIRNISSLDISDNGFDADMLTLLPALGKNKSIRHLFIGKNFNVKSKTLDEVLQATVQLFQDEDCCLQSLSIANSKLKARCSVIINALGSNTGLRKVDLSGNGMQDIGAKMLAKALQINSSLRSVSWDRNNITAAGFLDVAQALQNNYTLRSMPIPLCDLTQTYRNRPEKTEEALQKIQRALLRNNQTQKFSQEQAFRLQQGIMSSTAEQMMDRLCVKVHNDLKLLRNCPLEAVQRDTRYAKEMVKDAKNSRALFPSLYELGHLLALDGPVRNKLDSVSLDVSQAVDQEVQMLLDSMLCLTRELCPLATRKAEANQKLCVVADRVTVSRSFVRGVLLEDAGTAIHNKLNEVMLAVVTSLTNCIMDEILQELYQSHKKLARHILQLQRLTEPDSLTLGPLPERQTRNQERDPDEGTDDELSTSIDTLAIRRQTVHSRRIRPISAFLSVSELELDRVTEDDSVSGRLSTSTTSSQHSRSLETLTDLPTEGLKLEHQTRVRPRPRRNNRQPPTKTNNIPFAETEEENGAGSKLDEGLENFYNWNMSMDAAEAPRESPQTSQPPSAPVPKKRKSRRRGGLFRFMRGRSAREESSSGRLSGPPASRGSEEEAGEDEDKGPPDRAAGSPGRGPERQGETEEDGMLREARPGQIVARPVQGILLPGMGGSRPMFHQDGPPPTDRCYMKTSTSSSSSDRLEECGQPFIPLLPSKKPAWGRKTEAEIEATPEMERRRETRDRGDVRGLPPPPPPPPQEAKPTWSGSRPYHNDTSAGGGDFPGDSSPARDPRHTGSRARETDPDRCGVTGMDGGSREEGTKAGRRILVPPTSRIPGTEKRPKERLPTAPPPPPPADCKPRLEEEEEVLARGGGGRRKSPPPGRGAHPEEDAEEEEEEGGGAPETGRSRKPPVKPRRSKRGQFRGRMVSDSEDCSGRSSQSDQPGIEVTQRPRRPPLKQKPVTVRTQSESPGALDQRQIPQTDSTRFSLVDDVLHCEDNRSQSDV